MAAETNTTEQESQIQEKTITSQTEDLKKKVDDVDPDERPPINGNHDTENAANGNGVPHDEKPPIEEDVEEEETNEADAGIADEPDAEPENNEADANNEAEMNNEADSGTAPEEEEVTNGNNDNNEPAVAESTEADSGTTNVEVDTTQGDEPTAMESVTSTETPADSNGKETETNGVKDKEEKSSSTAEKKDASLGSTVAKHYNDIAPITRESRKDSRIFHLRNFNNWVKSVVISEFLEKVKRRKRVSDDVNVLDIACGKGGDILKWQKGKIDHVIMADIAAKSIDECKDRYKKLERDQRHNRYSRERLFTAEFFVADCTKKRLCDMYRNKGIKLDMASCQFAFHYSFESYEQADLMLKNCCENLRVGGYFIGTTPDAQKLVKHIKACKADSFGNSVFNIKPEDKESFALFGSKYMFYLEGVVDCPEFIVYLPLLEKMAAKYNMKLVWKKNFHDLFKDYNSQYSSLLTRMNALESYPSSSGQQAGGSESQYKSAKDYVDKKGKGKVGTLSADEWEVAGLYIAFAFEKMESPKDKERSDRKRDDRRDRGDERKRTRDDRVSSDRDRDRSDDRSRKTSDSGSSKRSRRDAEDEYEIKDEVYDDDDKPDDRSRSSKSSRSSSSNRRSHRDESSRSSRKSESSSSKRDEKSEPSKKDSPKEDEKKEEETIADKSKETVETTDAPSEDTTAAAVSSSEPGDAEMTEPTDAAEEPEEVESSTVVAEEEEEVESTTAEEEREDESTVTPTADEDVEPEVSETVPAEEEEEEPMEDE
jgi:mRNA (guanine-N7-)-methyltransferase